MKIDSSQVGPSGAVADDALAGLVAMAVSGAAGVSRGELVRMIATGKVEALETGVTRMIPSAGIERLHRPT